MKETFFPKGSGLRLSEADVVFLHVCRWICVFRSFNVCTGMAGDDLAGSVKPKRPAGFLFSWCLFFPPFCLATQAQRPLYLP